MRIPLAIFLLAAAPALAQPAIQSNIGLAQYPAPKCAVPPPAGAEEPKPPATQNPSEGQAELYNRQVRAYNAAMVARNGAMKAYSACVQDYVTAAKADLDRIQSAVNAAVAAANSAQ